MTTRQYKKNELIVTSCSLLLFGVTRNSIFFINNVLGWLFTGVVFHNWWGHFKFCQWYKDRLISTYKLLKKIWNFIFYLFICEGILEGNLLWGGISFFRIKDIIYILARAGDVLNSLEIFFLIKFKNVWNVQKINFQPWFCLYVYFSVCLDFDNAHDKRRRNVVENSLWF